MAKINSHRQSTGSTDLMLRKIVGNLYLQVGKFRSHQKTGEMLEKPSKNKTQQVLKNIAAILEEAGTNFDHVVKTTCF